MRYLLLSALMCLVGCGRSDLASPPGSADMMVPSVSDMTPPPVCLTTVGADDFANASQLHFACSPKAFTCMLTYVDGTITPSMRMYLMNGERLPSHPLPHATDPVFPVGFVLGTPDGFLVSGFEGSMGWDVPWLLQTDDVGVTQYVKRAYFPTDPVGYVATSIPGEGEWVMTDNWDHPNQNATYYSGRVVAGAAVTEQQSFTTARGSCMLSTTFMSEAAGTAAILTEWSSYGPGKTRGVSVFLKHGADPVVEVELVGSSAVSFNASCDVFHPLGVSNMDGDFVAAWHDTTEAKSYAARIDVNGHILSRVEIHPDITDFVPIKGGFATVSYHPITNSVSLEVWDTDWQKIGSFSIQSGGTPREGPIVVTDGVVDGRFAIAWIDAQSVGHVFFLAYC